MPKKRLQSDSGASSIINCSSSASGRRKSNTKEVRNYPRHHSNHDLKSSPPTSLRLKEVQRLLEHALVSNIGRISESGSVSIYKGVSGIFLLHEFLLSSRGFGLVSENQEEPLFLKPCLQAIHNTSKPFRISFLEGIVGPLTLVCLYYHRRDDLENFNKYLNKIISIFGSLEFEESPYELLYGKAGYLYGLLLIRNRTGSTKADTVIREVIIKIISSGRSSSEERSYLNIPLLYSWHEKVYFGAAHGLGGILQVLLLALDFLEDSEKNWVKETLIRICTLQFESGNFPSSLESKGGDRLVQWCHGSPGLIPTLLKASKEFPEVKEQFLRVSVKASEDIWNRGLLTKGFGLCHGISGNSYAFLSLFVATKKESFLNRAKLFAELSVDHSDSEKYQCPEEPLSLFNGIAGAVYLLADLTSYCTGKFPGFDI